MNFCSHCGSAAIAKTIPEDDNRVRDVCPDCGSIFYENPKIVAGCLLEWQGSLLLCRRAIEPRRGYWTLPAGFMEKGESLAEGAAREALEEANAQADHLSLYNCFSLPHISQVYVMFRGTLRDGAAAAGAESLEVGLYEEAEIPWDNLAFPIVVHSLQYYFEDRRAGHFQTRVGVIRRTANQRLEVIADTLA